MRAPSQYFILNAGWIHTLELFPRTILDALNALEREASWGDRLSSDLRDTVLALSADDIIGLVSWGRTDLSGLPELHLMSLYVKADYRGSGVADELLELALEDAPAYLFVFEENHRAQAFYAKHGFVTDGYREIETRTDVWEVRMVRTSANPSSRR